MPRKGTLTKTITLPDGSRKWITAKTKEELERKVLECQLKLSMGVDLRNHDTFGEFALLWYKTYKEPKRRPQSLAVIKRTINNHLLPAFSGYKMDAITPMMIEQFFAAKNQAGYANSTLQIMRCYLHEIFDRAVENNVLLRSPMHKIELGGKKKKEREPLTSEESEALLDGLLAWDDAKAQFCYRFCLLALKTGMRRGELLGLMWSDIDFENDVIHVQRQSVINGKCVSISTDLKSAHAYRDIPVPQSAMRMLREERRTSNSLYVFSLEDGQPMSQSAFASAWTRAKRINHDVFPHLLRHTYCTRLFEAGLDVKEAQYLMGHSTPEITLKIYTHYRKTERFVSTADKVRAAI